VTPNSRAASNRPRPSSETCRTKGVLIYASELIEELEEAASADATSGELIIIDGPLVEAKEWLGGLTIV
jgi:hypothetical protein